MEASKVYYTSFKTSGSENLLQKLRLPLYYSWNEKY